MNWYLCKTKILGRVNVRAEKLGVGSKELGKLSANRSTLTKGKGTEGVSWDKRRFNLLNPLEIYILVLIIIPSHLSCKCNKG
jgi:hypothetical protein